MKNIKIIVSIIVIIIAILVICLFTKKEEPQVIYEESDITTIWTESDTITFTEDKNINASITQGGTYKLTGKSTNSSITINTEDEVVLILDNLELTNENGPAILIENAKKTIITLNDNTVNKLSNGNNEEFDAVIYSKDDLTINGEGTLEITSNYENGIKCNNDLKIMSGNITIKSTTNGIIGKDSITIKSGNINITSGKDGIKTNNEEGNIIIEEGNITIKSENDGIQAENELTINNGTINITTNSGQKTLTGKQFDTKQDQTEESMKAIKASNIIINNGSFIINSYEDGIHSNGNLTINAGTFEIKSSDDAIHADGIVEINDGTFNINAAEGIEATYVKINDGNITIYATDDGINAGKKTDEIPIIEINGGNIKIEMAQGDTDGLDSNGNLYINGGTIDITCNSPFDYDKEEKYTGGKLIVNGKETTELTNQMMGGMQGGMPNDRPNMNGAPMSGMRR